MRNAKLARLLVDAVKVELERPRTLHAARFGTSRVGNVKPGSRTMHAQRRGKVCKSYVLQCVFFSLVFTLLFLTLCFSWFIDSPSSTRPGSIHSHSTPRTKRRGTALGSCTPSRPFVQAPKTRSFDREEQVEDKNER